MGKKLSWIALSMVMVAILGLNSISFAGSYPEKPINVIIPLSAGGTTDIVVRTLAPHMEKFLGQPLVMLNKPGANGSIAIAELAGKKPDGYHFAWSNLPTVVTQPQMLDLTYDAKKLVYVASPMFYEYILYVRADAPWNTLKEFLDYAKEHPGEVTYGTPGIGSTNHLAMEWLGNKEGIKWRAVPFKGNPESISALLGGHITAINTSTSASVSTYQAGKIKPLAILSNKRVALMPDVPTLRDLGYDFDQYSNLGALLPEGTPEEIRQRLEDAIKYACEQPEVLKQAQETLYVTIDFKNGKEYRDLCDQYWTVWGDIMAKLDLLKK